MSDELGLTTAEKALFQALDDLGVRCLVVGLSAALVEGAPVVTQDIDLWFGPGAPWEKIGEAARRAGGFYTSGLGLQRPTLGGPGLDRIDIVLNADGLEDFDQEYARSKEYEIQGVRLRALTLERILASKRAAGRPKDIAAIPALEDALAARRAREARRFREGGGDDLDPTEPRIRSKDPDRHSGNDGPDRSEPDR